MARAARAVLGGAALSLLGGCSASVRVAPAGQEPPDSILFSHSVHADQPVPCGSCHRGAEQADDLRARHSPKKEICAACHEVDKARFCGKCHSQPSRPRALPRAARDGHYRFSHRQHLAAGGDCLSCHAGAAVAPTLAQVPRPRMRQDCLSCHVHKEQFAALRCQTCHLSLSLLPIEALAGFSHEGGDYLAEHGKQARGGADLCQTCHTQSFCADCHSSRGLALPSVRLAERTDRQLIHRGDFLSQHALRARADPGGCHRCHSPKACARCHRASGVSASASGARSPHPPDWLSPASPNNHGVEARLRITQCAACHDRGALSNCVRCHKSVARGGLGLRPHPPGFDRGDPRSEEVCRVCH